MNDEKIVAEIKRRILELIVDNPCLAAVQLQLETAALIGASVALELKDVEDFCPFSPTVLTWRDLDERAASIPLGEG